MTGVQTCALPIWQQGCTGYTPNYTPVTVCDPAAHPGDIRPVLLTAIAPDADGCEGILTD